MGLMKGLDCEVVLIPMLDVYRVIQYRNALDCPRSPQAGYTVSKLAFISCLSVERN